MSGWKQWQVAEVVDADDFQTYLQNQVVQVYDNATARTTALGTAVAAGMMSYLIDTGALQVYGTAWADVSNPGDITAVTAGTGLTGGGTSGDVTLNADYGAIGSAVLASPNITGTATISAGSVTGNLIVSGTATFSADTSIGSVSSTELSYLDGVTSAIQTQLNARVLQTNGVVTTATVGSVVVRNIAISTATPSGGMDGDVWLQYTP
jgi:hypothetical protein